MGTIGQGVASSRLAQLMGLFLNGPEHSAQALDDLRGRHDTIGAPLAPEGHEFDKAHLKGMALGESDKVCQLVVVDSTDDHRI